MTMEIGVGQIEFYSYWLVVSTPQKEIIWSGSVSAKEVKDASTKRLELEFVPKDLQETLENLQRAQPSAEYYCKWERAWEEIAAKEIIDGNNIVGGEADRQSNGTSVGF